MWPSPEGHFAAYAPRMRQLASNEAVAPVTLEGRNVRLEPLSMDHVEALAAAAAESRDTYGWTFVPEGIEGAREYVAAALDLGEKRQAVPFATVALASGRVVGSTRFATFEYHGWPPASPHYRGEGVPDAVEIGWTWLAASAQRTPINTEAKWLMLRHAFTSWRVLAVRLNTDRRNERSRTAIKRIGGRLDGILRANRMGADGAVRDSAAYSIIESEWPAVDAALRERLARS